MPMKSAFLKLHKTKNARPMPMEPRVKSGKARDLLKNDARQIGRIKKSADPICYNIGNAQFRAHCDKVGHDKL